MPSTSPHCSLANLPPVPAQPAEQTEPDPSGAATTETRTAAAGIAIGAERSAIPAELCHCRALSPQSHVPTKQADKSPFLLASHSLTQPRERRERLRAGEGEGLLALTQLQQQSPLSDEPATGFH